MYLDLLSFFGRAAEGVKVASLFEKCQRMWREVRFRSSRPKVFLGIIDICFGSKPTFWISSLNHDLFLRCNLLCYRLMTGRSLFRVIWVLWRKLSAVGMLSFSSSRFPLVFMENWISSSALNFWRRKKLRVRLLFFVSFLNERTIVLFTGQSLS